MIITIHSHRKNIKPKSYEIDCFAEADNKILEYLEEKKIKHCNWTISGGADLGKPEITTKGLGALFG